MSVNVERQSWMSKLDVKTGCQSWIELRKLDFCRIGLPNLLGQRGRHGSLVDPYATLAAGLLEPNSLDADAEMLKRL